MQEPHLSAIEIEQMAEEGATFSHVATCASCQHRVARAKKLITALRDQPRADTPNDLAPRIIAASELMTRWRSARRASIPEMTAATAFTFLVAIALVWNFFGALEQNGTLDFFDLLASPELITAYFSDYLLALFETLPLVEFALASLAVMSVIVFARQWIELVESRISFPARSATRRS
ncbi:MAG: hypothetical protein HY070_11340 [Chloroflexi bacterium]|nr:hypothetical protein [Chloroflexota bacterium]